MKVSTQRLPESQVLLEIEVDPEQMERSLDRAYRRLVQRVDVPGFRKGKTPRPMLERHLGRDRLVHEAHDILLREVVPQVLDQESIEAIDAPRIDEIITDEPFSFKATVPIRPTVDLGNYAKLRLEREIVSVDEGEIDRMVEELRHRYAVHEPAERAVQTGDIVRANVRGEIDGREIYKDGDVQFHLREGSTILLPGFAEGLVGAEKGVQKEIPVSVPEGQGQLAGKSGVFSVTISDVKEVRLPELDDEFARGVGEGFAGVEELRERLRTDVREKLEAQAEEAYREKAVTALADASAKIEFPPVLVDRELERFVHEQAHAAGRNVDDYLKLLKQSPDEVREKLVPACTERVRRSLALSRFAEAEEIGVEGGEVDAEVERIVTSAGGDAERVRRLFSTADARASIERALHTRKTLDRLVEIASGMSRERPTGSDAAVPATSAASPKEES